MLRASHQQMSCAQRTLPAPSCAAEARTAGRGEDTTPYIYVWPIAWCAERFRGVWLVPLGLVEYADSFRAKGYDTVDDVRAMDSKELGELCDRIGMKEGHAKRLLRHLREEG